MSIRTGIFKALITGFILWSYLTMMPGLTVAFDLTKSEAAGNADWIIGSAPNYTGAYSEYGAALRTLGFTTTTLTGSSITASMLANVNVLVLPEPQDPFTTAERTALLNFVQNGGGLFLIADHDGSDRNNNGWDSRRVYNESLLTATNFGISFDANSLYADPTSLIESPATALTGGITQVGMYAGCSITPSGTAACHVWLRNNSEEGLVTSTYGNGRVAAYGDSSPFDDGTGNSGNELYDGWSDYNNAQMGTNIIQWLAQQASNPVTVTNPVLVPAQPIVNQPTEVRVTIQSAQSLSYVYLYWKISGGFNPVAMTLLSGSVYRCTIPAQGSACLMQFYVQARSSANINGYYPANAPAALASFHIISTANEDEVLPTLSPKAFPNPVWISFQALNIKTEPRTKIAVYNLKGALVREILPSNSIDASWDGRDKAGHDCPPGTYLVRFTGKSKTRSQSIMLLR